MFTQLKQRRMRWLGHVMRMDYGRIPKDLLYGELVQAKRPTGRPQLRFKDVCKRDLKALNIDQNNWEATALRRSAWRQTVQKGLSNFEETLAQQHREKRMRRKAAAHADRQASDLVCVLCHNCLFVDCLTSQQQASVSQGRICSDNFTCCHTEIEVADQTFCLTQSQYTDNGPTSPSTDPITPGAWQGSHWSANFEVTGMTRPRKNPGASGNRTRDLPLSRRTPYHQANEAVLCHKDCHSRIGLVSHTRRCTRINT